MLGAGADAGREAEVKFIAFVQGVDAEEIVGDGCPSKVRRRLAGIGHFVHGEFDAAAFDAVCGEEVDAIGDGGDAGDARRGGDYARASGTPERLAVEEHGDGEKAGTRACGNDDVQEAAAVGGGTDVAAGGLDAVYERLET